MKSLYASWPRPSQDPAPQLVEHRIGALVVSRRGRRWRVGGRQQLRAAEQAAGDRSFLGLIKVISR